MGAENAERYFLMYNLRDIRRRKCTVAMLAIKYPEVA